LLFVFAALKFRFALGVHGYEFLRNTNYPLPGYSTLTRRLRELEFNFGIFKELKIPLASKVEKLDRFCILSIDEMYINDSGGINKNKMEFSGGVTLGPSTDKAGENNINDTKGNQLLVALIRGAMEPWKQVIGCHITSNKTSGTDLKKFVYECIDFATELGLKVVAITSDMGGKNRNLWNELKISVNKIGARLNKFEYKKKGIYVIADQCHLLKNLKSTLLNGYITIPEYFKFEENIPSQTVSGCYIKQLWDKEVTEERELRLLHHLKREDIFPDNFQKMHVGAAIRFFSMQTVAAIQVAVKLQILPENALSTAAFIKLVYQWFEMINSKTRKTSITKKNQVKKYDFLMKFITTISDTQFNGTGWKPLNTGLILTTLSICDVTQVLLKNGYDFILTHRFTQDALENVFSQTRRRIGKLPSSTDCLNVMKIIAVSEFVSDVKRTNYCSDSDLTLVEHCKQLHSTAAGKIRPEIIQLDHSYYFDKFSLNTHILDTVPLQEKYSELDLYSLNLIYNIGGSTVNACIKKCCSSCKMVLLEDGNDNVSIKKWKIYKSFLNMGGLKEPNVLVVQLLVNCELQYQHFRGHIMHNGAVDLVSKIIKEININFQCQSGNGCDLKALIVKHYFTVRNYSVVNYIQSTKKKKIIHGSATKK